MKEQKQELTKKEEEKLAFQRNFSDSVMNSITKYCEEGRLRLPKGYSAENALKSAWLIVQKTVDKENKPALAVCTPNSVANALLEMAIMGLNPAKSQCYFIVYGKELTMTPSYFGKITALKRIEGIEDINAQVIYEGDEIEYNINSDGSISNIKHYQEFQNIKEDKIIGGYCVIKYKGEEYATIATYEQIKEAWSMSKMSKDKKTFKSEFVKRTMINKSIKWFVNTRNDDDLLIETIQENETRHYDYDNAEIDEFPPIQEVKVDELPHDEVKEAIVEEVKEENNAIEVDKFE